MGKKLNIEPIFLKITENLHFVNNKVSTFVRKKNGRNTGVVLAVNMKPLLVKNGVKQSNPPKQADE